MTEIILALGSNVQQKKHMEQANQLLSERLGNIVFSEMIWTEPIGLDSDKFLNEVVCAQTNLPVEEVLASLKKIEVFCGRSHEESQKGIIHMDIDLLMYGKERFHKKDWERAYLQKLLKQLGVL